MNKTEYRKDVIDLASSRYIPYEDRDRPEIAKFFEAARLDTLISGENELTRNEVLEYVVRHEYSDVSINTPSAALDFVNGLKPDDAAAIRKRADEMFDTARLLFEGKLEGTFGETLAGVCRNGRKLTAEEQALFTPDYIGPRAHFTYTENPQISIAEMQSKIRMEAALDLFYFNDCAQRTPWIEEALCKVLK